MKNGKVQHGALKSTASKFDLNRATIVSVRKRGQAPLKTDAVVADLLTRQKGRVD